MAEARHARHARQPQPAPARQASSKRYIASIDGLRAFAVLAVIAYHMKFGWASGGLAGVTVFFVISGYLICGLLVAEHDRTGTINLPQFWLRRVRRLFAAIALAVVGTWALCALFNHVLLGKMLPDIVPSLFFYNNWWQIFHEISYFEAAGSPSPLTHFWSLAIEEQFYIVWPILLFVLLGRKVPKKRIAVVVAVLAVLSALEMALLYDPHGDPSRVYYGTDTRAFSLLAGVWLAFVWPSAAFGEKRTSAGNATVRLGFNIVGVLALVGLFAIVGFTDGFSAFPYRGGIALTTALAALLMMVLVVPGTWVDRLFSLKPLVYIGKLSYSMYLWHFPIILLTTNVNSTTGTPWYVHVLQLVLTVVVAALSFKYVEDPIRHGAIGAWWREVRERGLHATAKARAVAVPAASFTVLLAVALVGTACSAGQDSVGQASVPAASSAVSASSASSEAVFASGVQDEATGSASSASASSSTASSASAVSSGSRTYDQVFREQHTNTAGQPVYEPLLIGDSVSLGAEDAFYAEFPYGHLDSVVSRNVWESPYQDYADADQVGDYVVFCLGTNNAVVDWQIDDELLNVVPESKHVIMVNTRNPEDWCESTNDTINRVPERHPNVTVVDWYGASAGHDEYFAGDGTHLTEEGAAAYIALIRDALADQTMGHS